MSSYAPPTMLTSLDTDIKIDDVDEQKKSTKDNADDLANQKI